jgi:predicted nucleic acid-binding Zn ribbon protein
VTKDEVLRPAKIYKPIDAPAKLMRSSLVVSGGIIGLTGVVLYVALDGSAWLALIGGGVFVLFCGFLLKDVTDRLEPPPGHRFCPFCSTPVAEGVERCSHCNGLQESAAQSRQAAPRPNSQSGNPGARI